MIQTYNAGDGTVCTVIWLTADNQPTEPDKASFARMTFSDGESAVFSVEGLRTAEWDESQHPRDEAGKFTSGGGASLTSGKVISSKKITGSINGVEKLTLKDAQGHTTRAIFKPTSGESWTNADISRKQFIETYGVTPESELGGRIMAGDMEDPAIQKLPVFDPDDYGGDFEDTSAVRDSIQNRDFTFAEREVAAYEVDRMLGLNVIPPTTLREINGQRGMVQEFVRADRRLDLSKVDPDSVYGAAILDIATGNTDRHDGNFLVANGRFVAIDQGLTFPSDKGSEFRPDAVVNALASIKSANMSADFAARVREKLSSTDWDKVSQAWHMSTGERKYFRERMDGLRRAFEEYDNPSKGVKDLLVGLAEQSTIANPELLDTLRGR